jgi:hypothetical protein
MAGPVKPQRGGKRAAARSEGGFPLLTQAGLSPDPWLGMMRESSAKQLACSQTAWG